MVLISCDLCGKEIIPELSQYYVVRMEVLARGQSELTDEDLSVDNLQAVSSLLQTLENEGMSFHDAPARQVMKFDLCSNCRTKFVKDPLNREAMSLDFSTN
ncbi:MAG: hypothetical protein U0796_16275 [Gemmatales bacterium]